MSTNRKCMNWNMNQNKPNWRTANDSSDKKKIVYVTSTASTIDNWSFPIAEPTNSNSWEKLCTNGWLVAHWQMRIFQFLTEIVNIGQCLYQNPKYGRYLRINRWRNDGKAAIVPEGGYALQGVKLLMSALHTKNIGNTVLVVLRLWNIDLKNKNYFHQSIKAIWNFWYIFV